MELDANLLTLVCTACALDMTTLQRFARVCRKWRCMTESYPVRSRTRVDARDNTHLDVIFRKGWPLGNIRVNTFTGDLKKLFKCIDLKCLIIGNPLAQFNLDHLSSFTRLEKLSIGVSYPDIDLSSLSDLTSLRDLNIYGDATEYEFIANLTELRRLSLTECPIRDLRPLSKLKHLKDLRLDSCSTIEDLEPLASVQSLQDLDLGHCDGIENVAPLATLHLRYLNLSDAYNIQDIDTILHFSQVSAAHLWSMPHPSREYYLANIDRYN